MDTYLLHSRIDSSNADDFEKEIRQAYSEGFPEELALDASELTYISSAGLRALLRLKREIPCLHIIHVSSDVYEILEITGFDQILEAKKTLKKIDIQGCPEIGRGAHGAVYRLAPDTIVKVYYPGESLESIQREQELARWAFVQGIPTAIPHHVVQVGDQYGIVFELLDARSSSEYVMESRENLEDFVEKSVRLMKQIHAIKVEPGELADMKQKMLEWAEAIRRDSESRPEEGLPAETCDRIEKMIRETPDTQTLLHADLHLKNILICGEELMLIDMETLCMGDPIFDLTTIFNSYREFPSIDPAAAAFLGIDVETAYEIFDRTMDQYLSGVDPTERAEIIRRAHVFGIVRIIDYTNRHVGLPDRERILERCLQDLEKLV